MITPPEKMSQVFSVHGQSPRGFVNKEEAVKSLNKGGAWAALLAAIGGCLLALANDFPLIYNGPLKEVLSMVAGAAVVYFTTKRNLNKFAEQGKELDDRTR